MNPLQFSLKWQSVVCFIRLLVESPCSAVSSGYRNNSMCVYRCLLTCWSLFEVFQGQKLHFCVKVPGSAIFRGPSVTRIRYGSAFDTATGTIVCTYEFKVSQLKRDPGVDSLLWVRWAH